MRKALTILLALSLALSFGAAAFAEDNTRTVSTTVNHDPSYTIHIPGNTVIPQDTTDPVPLGEEGDSVYVTDLQYMDGKKVTCAVTTESLKNGDAVIPTTYTYQTKSMGSAAAMEKFDCDVKGASDGDNYVGTKIFAQVDQSAWDNAANGSYSATLSFVFTIEDAGEPEPTKSDWNMTFSDTNWEGSVPSEGTTITFNAAEVSDEGEKPEIRYTLMGGEGAVPTIPDVNKPQIKLLENYAVGECYFIIKATAVGDETHNETSKTATITLNVIG